MVPATNDCVTSALIHITDRFFGDGIFSCEFSRSQGQTVCRLRKIMCTCQMVFSKVYVSGQGCNTKKETRIIIKMELNSVKHSKATCVACRKSAIKGSLNLNRKLHSRGHNWRKWPFVFDSWWLLSDCYLYALSQINR